MPQTAPPANESYRSDGAKALAVLLLACGLLLLAASIAGGTWDAGRAPLPFVWRDVAVVYLLCALPLSSVVAGLVVRKLNGVSANVVAGVLFACSLGILLFVAEPSTTNALKSSAWLGVALRSILALAVATAGVTIATLLLGRANGIKPGSSLRNAAEWIGLGIAALWLAPATYAAARVRHDAAKLSEYVQESRFGEARSLIEGLLVLDAGGQWNGQPLAAAAHEIKSIETELQRRVSTPLPPLATPDAYLQRAGELAMLGRAEMALAMLSEVQDPIVAPDVDNLRGSIEANRGAWQAGLASYERARRTWTARPHSAARDAGLLRATTGAAYCQRKAGQYVEAAATYQQMLELSPTADSHFLLAQFYEDAQQSDRARMHARKAMAMSPERYRQPAEKLLAKLTVFHFGCLGVYRAEQGDGAAGRLP